MPTVLVSPPIDSAAEPEPAPSDNQGKGNGTGGGRGDPGHHRPENSGPGQAAPLSAYRLFTALAIIWIVTLFAALTIVLESRWVHSADWVSTPLPAVFYASTAVLLLSSLSIEIARWSLRTETLQSCARWIAVTLVLGVAFIGAQFAAWRELAFRGVHFASNPGSFFLYLITGAHGLHLVVGIAALGSVGIFLRRATSRAAQQAAIGTVAIYWHFINGLWFYLLMLLRITVQG